MIGGLAEVLFFFLPLSTSHYIMVVSLGIFLHQPTSTLHHRFYFLSPVAPPGWVLLGWVGLEYHTRYVLFFFISHLFIILLLARKTKTKGMGWEFFLAFSFFLSFYYCWWWWWAVCRLSL